MKNTAYQDDFFRYECYNGKLVAMSPRPSIDHSRVVGNIYRLLYGFFRDRSCEAFSDGIDVHFDEKTWVVPDGMVVCRHDFIKRDGIYGPPDLIVEVLSPGTAKNDKGVKKKIYESFGVAEYWIVDINNRSVDVNCLQDGRYVLEEVCSIYPEYLLKKMSEQEKEKAKDEFYSRRFPELKVSLKDVFEDVVFC